MKEMIIKTYVINLKDSVDRRKAVLAETAKYPFMDVELVEAVDGRKMSQEDIDRQFDYRRFQSHMGYEVLPGEIGCTLSHRECYRKLLSSKEEVALILEDDVVFLAREERVNELIATITGQMTDEPCAFTLTRHISYYSQGQQVVGEYTFCRVKEAFGTCAYLINRKAAEILLNLGKPYFVADDFLLMHNNHIRVKGLYPMLAIGDSELHKIDSLICDDWGKVPKCKVSFLTKIQKLISNGYRRLLYVTGILRRRKDNMKIICPYEDKNICD